MNIKKGTRPCSWWHKQNLALRTTIIAGCFSIAVACLGIAGTIISTLVTHYISTSQKVIPVINVYSFYVSPQGFHKGDLYVIDSLGEMHILATNNCIQVEGEGVDIRIPPSPDNELAGYIGVSIDTNVNILIKKISIEQLEFSDYTPPPPLSFRFNLNPQGGGVIITPIVLDTLLVISQSPGSQIVTEWPPYKLSKNDGAVFLIPARVLGQGRHKIIARVIVSPFSSDMTISSQEIEISWAYVPNVDPTIIQTDLPDLEVSTCQR
jgi:hypothetical protein